ncbi:MAG: class I SAM-dependent methyltransferase [Bacteroidales bacterium]|nr:class I SAM-dependent methyltransferase [Bacteroidales bacterium]
MSENKMVSFDMERAISYDQRNRKLGPLSESLHLQMRIILSGLPADANILCVGAGTGAELLFLAKAFPSWQFTALDPAEAMLNLCKQKAFENGIDQRCTFHCGYIESLPESKPFDAATSILVSHFLMDKVERAKFFAQIAARLRPGGFLVNADLSFDTSASGYTTLMATWLQLLKYADWPADNVDQLPEVYKQNVAMLPPAEVESIIQQGGFNAPVLFSQSHFIHGWFAQKS